MSSTCRFRGVLPLALLSIQRGGGPVLLSPFPPPIRPKYHSNNPATTTPSPSPSPPWASNPAQTLPDAPINRRPSLLDLHLRLDSQPTDQPPRALSFLIFYTALLFFQPTSTTTRQRPVFTAVQQKKSAWLAGEPAGLSQEKSACLNGPASPLLFTPSLPLRSLPLGCCRPAYYSALLVALSLAQPSPAQPLKQSINHSLLDLAPRRRLFSCTNRTGLYCTSRTKGDGKQPLYTSPLLAKTATPFSPLALKLN